jgi:hypothetical protein
MATINANICIRRDTAANWTSNNPTLLVGEMCYETDTGKFKVGTGTTWTATSYSGGVTAPGLGAITRTVDAKLLDTVSVKDFGAVGDGVTNDTAALQLALDASVGKSLFVPPGTYRTTAVLRIKEKTCFFAQKGTATIDVQPTGGTTSLTHGILIDGNEVVIDGLKISGTNQTTVVGGFNVAYAKGIVADAAISGTVFTRPTITNCLIFKWGYGIELRRASTFTVTNNRIWGGAQLTDSNPGSASTTDLSIYGSTGANASFRGIVTGNFCLGNNDAGISCGINGGGDRDVTISNNVVEPLQEDGITPIADVNNKTRYGIIVGYGGENPCRTVISNNVVRNYAITGINSQTKIRPGGDLIISNNMISGCGRDTFYVTDRGFKAGIFVDGGADSITGNVVLDCCRAGIISSNVMPVIAGTQHNRPVISGNTISRITVDTITSPSAPGGHGIFVTGPHISGVLVSSNMVQDIAATGIKVIVEGGTGNGDVSVVGNQVINGTKEGGIQIVNLGGLDCAVSGNKISGTDNVDSNTGLNAGIWFQGRVHCTGNTINKFHRGIQSQLSARTTDIVCAGNSISNTVFGIAGAAQTGPWLISDNTFTSVSNSACHAAPYQGMMVREMAVSTGTKVDIIQVTALAPPTAGTWEVGDYVKNSTPIAGRPTGWYCTVRATHPTLATWVSEGNLIVPLTVTQLNALPAGSKTEGARGFCTDATTTTFGSTVVGGGANNVSVYHDGTDWKIG